VKRFLSAIPDARVRASLMASTIDGGLWALMYGFAEYFILPFAIFFGANALQTSLVQGMGQLGVAVAQLLGAALVARFGMRKRISRVAVGFHALSWLAVFAVAALTRDPWTIVLFYSLGVFVSSIASPGWLSWMNDLVPMPMRGAFWGKRNTVLGVVQFAAIAVAGLALRYAEPRGGTLLAFGILFGLAALSRASCVIFLGIQHDPALDPAPGEAPGSAMGDATRGARRDDASSAACAADAATGRPGKRTAREGGRGFISFLRSLPQGGFGRFVIFSVLMNFSINVMGPVLPVFLLKSMGLDYFSYTAVTMVSMVLSYVAMSYWGPLTDRFGNRRILLVTAGALPLLALGWIFAKGVPAMLALQAFSGFVLAGFNLSTTNYVFDSEKKDRIASTMANFNALNNGMAFAGSITGGLVATAVAALPLAFLAPQNIEIVFALSALLRLAVFIGLSRGFPEVREVESSPPVTHFYLDMPWALVVDRVGTRRRGNLPVDSAATGPQDGAGDGKDGAGQD
jgi:MFS family permease